MTHDPRPTKHPGTVDGVRCTVYGVRRVYACMRVCVCAYVRVQPAPPRPPFAVRSAPVSPTARAPAATSSSSLALTHSLSLSHSRPLTLIHLNRTAAPSPSPCSCVGPGPARRDTTQHNTTQTQRDRACARSRPNNLSARQTPFLPCSVQTKQNKIKQNKAGGLTKEIQNKATT
jgi:hypothetical protein